MIKQTVEVPISVVEHILTTRHPSDKQILVIADSLRIAYLRGSRDPTKANMTNTIHELRDYIVNELKKK